MGSGQNHSRSRCGLRQSSGHGQHFEALEIRQMLSAAAVGVVPTSIAPGTITENLLLPSGSSRHEINVTTSGQSSRFFKLATNGATLADPLTLLLEPANPALNTDAAIAFMTRTAT